MKQIYKRAIKLLNETNLKTEVECADYLARKGVNPELPHPNMAIEHFLYGVK